MELCCLFLNIAISSSETEDADDRAPLVATLPPPHIDVFSEKPARYLSFVSSGGL